MKYIKLTCVFLFIIHIPNTFSQSNADYFPWKTGDMWEYTLYYWPDIDTLQSIVIDDSTDEAGNIYTTHFSRAINPIEPPTALLTDTIVYKIDTSLYVYHRNFDFNTGEWINVYRLNSNTGDQWIMWDYSHTGAGPFEMARIDSIEETVLFEDNTQLMYMSYFLLFFDGTDTSKLYRYYDQLAKGFGFYFRGSAELDAQLYLHGCVLNGILYGDTTKIVTSINDSQINLSYIDDFEISQNYPNPFNNTTRIPVKLYTEGLVSLSLYDLLGNKVQTIIDEQFYTPGYYEFYWDGKNEVSGIYFYEIRTEKFRDIKKLVLVK